MPRTPMSHRHTGGYYRGVGGPGCCGCGCAAPMMALVLMGVAAIAMLLF